MKLSITNIGPLNRVNLEISDFTLIGGENQVGKSFVTKCLYSLLEPCAARWLGSEVPIPALEKRIARKWKQVFQQTRGTIVNHFRDAEQGICRIDDDIVLCADRQDKVKVRVRQPFRFGGFSLHYVSTPAVLDLEKAIGSYRELYKDNYGVGDCHWDILRDIRNIDLAEKPELEQMGHRITEVVGGSFGHDTAGGTTFYMGLRKIPCDQIAYGIRIFGILQLLIGRDLLRAGSILILEEPEVHLHPSMRLMLMDILRELSEKGVRVVFTTHSPEIVRYVEYWMRTGKISANQCAFLHLRSDADAHSSSSLGTLGDLLSSLTAGYYEIILRQEAEFGS